MTHQLRRYVLPRTIALAAAVLIGCANYVSVTRIEPSTFASRESVVLLSVGAERLCFDGAAAGLGLYRRSPTLGRYEAVLEVPQIAMDTSMTDQELPDTHERLAAFVVRPGAYFFLPERRAGVVATKTPVWRFLVLPGETVYVGKLFMAQACSLHLSFALSDQYERDVALAIKLNPGFARRPVAHRLMTFFESLDN